MVTISALRALEYQYMVIIVERKMDKSSGGFIFRVKEVSVFYLMLAKVIFKEQNNFQKQEMSC
jgi:hypothetical protein